MKQKKKTTTQKTKTSTKITTKSKIKSKAKNSTKSKDKASTTVKTKAKTNTKAKAKKKKTKKQELEFEFIFVAENNEKIVLQRYTEKSMVWWDNGNKKKVWTGHFSICEASHFVKTTWPKRKTIYSNASYNPPPRPTDIFPCR